MGKRGTAAHLEVQRNGGKDQALEVLNEVVKVAQTVGVLGVLDVVQRADLGRLRTRMWGKSGQDVRVGPRGRSQRGPNALALDVERTVNEMCSLPSTISSSCRPSRSGTGHSRSSSLGWHGQASRTFATRLVRAKTARRSGTGKEESPYLTISLSSMIRLSSFSTDGLTITAPRNSGARGHED